MSENKLVGGTIARIEGNNAVLVFKDPINGEDREMDVPKDQIKGDKIKKGDPVLISLTMETKIPQDDSEIEAAFQKVFGPMTAETPTTVKPAKKAPAKKTKKG